MKRDRLIYCGLLLAMTLFSCKTTERMVSDQEVVSLLNTLDKEGVVRISDKSINLKGQTIKIGGRLVFEGCSKIINGTLYGDNGFIDCPNRQCFDKVIVNGTWENETGKLIWFTNGKDAKANFSALANLLDMQVRVQVDELYPLEVEANSSFEAPGDIIIEGKGPKKSGFILNTKLQSGEAYFQSAKGNNIFLKNISLISKDYNLNHKSKEKKYVFASNRNSFLNPKTQLNMSFFHLENCHLKGPICFSYHDNPWNKSLRLHQNRGIEKIVIRNCHIDETITTLELSNLPYGEAIIENNKITNILAQCFFSPLVESTRNITINW